MTKKRPPAETASRLPPKFRPKPMSFELPPHDLPLRKRRLLLEEMLRTERARFEYYQDFEGQRQATYNI